MASSICADLPMEDNIIHHARKSSIATPNVPNRHTYLQAKIDSSARRPQRQLQLITMKRKAGESKTPQEEGATQQPAIKIEEPENSRYS